LEWLRERIADKLDLANRTSGYQREARVETAQPVTSSLPMRNGEFKQLLDSYERSLIELALQDAGGNQRRASAALGILPTTLCEKMKRLGIRSRYREWNSMAADEPTATSTEL
jgi:DNA-binding NtrC family response regulator